MPGCAPAPARDDMLTLDHKVPPPLVATVIAFAMWPLSSLLRRLSYQT
jgi:hypothetical protein